MNKDKIISIIAISNFILPYGYIYNFISLLLIFGSECFSLKKNKSNNLFNFLTLCFISLAGFLGFLSLNLTVCLAAFLILIKNKKYRFIALILLLFELSITQNINAYFFNLNSIPQIQLLIPAYLVLFFYFGFSKKIKWLFISFLIITCFSYLLFQITNQTEIISFLIGLVSLLFIFFDNDHKNSLIKFEYIYLIIVAISLGLFLRFNIVSSNNLYFLLPDDTKSYESKYFTNYQNALNFGGFNSHHIKTIEELPNNSILLVPWVTNNDNNFLKILETLKNSDKQITVIISAEHTNYSGSMDVINQLLESKVVNNDITVPKGNKDISGFLRGINISEWPSNSIFNRGASLSPQIYDKTLLTGDLWHLESNMGNWLWVGDYIWQPKDEIGRVPLAILKQFKNKTFLILSDNSFLLNNQLISNPLPLHYIVNCAKIYPLLIKDTLIFILILFVLLNINAINFLIIFLLIYQLITSTTKTMGLWSDYNLGYLGFDQREFSNNILNFDELFNQNYKIYRTDYIDRNLLIKDENSLIFGLVKNQIRINETIINNCFRVGNLKFKEIFIMDGQFCSIDGKIDPLVFDENRFYIFKYFHNNYEKIIVLDRQFISNKAPLINLDFLKKQFNKFN